MAEASDITEKFYARFLEKLLGELVERDVACIAVAVRDEDGTISTGYCEASAFDKAMFAHVIQSDAMWDELEANAGLIRDMVEDADAWDDADGEDDDADE